MAKQKPIEKTTSKPYSEIEITELINGLFNFLNEKPEHVFVKDYLILEKQMYNSDIEILKEINPIFKTAIDNAMIVEETKLKKYAAADKLNATFVKEILNRDHNY